MVKIWLITAVLSLVTCSQEPPVIVGAAQVSKYLDLLQGKNIGIVANQTSGIGKIHMVDSLLSLSNGQFNIKKVFSPEHGFRGQAEAGEHVDIQTDPLSGLPLVSLYGSRRKPAIDDMEGLDLIIFDLQDVGVRFYTYISTLFYVMQACAEQGAGLIIMDRPNPNGFYVDGPVLDPEFASFVGMHRVPVVHGMTIGEYGLMINGQGWLGEGLFCDLQVIPCANYDHTAMYTLPVAPSPNLPNMNSIYLYPSLGFFEGTVISEGRGTDFPFEIFGHPDLMNCSYTFSPESRPGASLHPKLEGHKCQGMDLRYLGKNPERKKQLDLSWLLFAYRNFPQKDRFFIPYFDQLAGTDILRKQIVLGMEEEEIRQSWQTEIQDFLKIREKYLLYPDF